MKNPKTNIERSSKEIIKNEKKKKNSTDLPFFHYLALQRLDEQDRRRQTKISRI